MGPKPKPNSAQWCISKVLGHATEFLSFKISRRSYQAQLLHKDIDEKTCPLAWNINKHVCLAFGYNSAG